MAITISQVQQIIDYDTTFLSDIQPFIDSSKVLLDSIVGAALTGSAYDYTHLHLCAHLIAIYDPRVQAEQVKSLQQTFQVRLSDGLGITHYGTMAMLFDSTGKLANWNKRVVSGAAKVQFFWAGSTE